MSRAAMGLTYYLDAILPGMLQIAEHIVIDSIAFAFFDAHDALLALCREFLLRFVWRQFFWQMVCPHKTP